MHRLREAERGKEGQERRAIPVIIIIIVIIMIHIPAAGQLPSNYPLISLSLLHPLITHLPPPPLPLPYLHLTSPHLHVHSDRRRLDN